MKIIGEMEEITIKLGKDQMSEAAESGPLKSLPGLTLEKFQEVCDLTPEEIKDICQEVDKIKTKFDEAIASSTRAASDEAARELAILELEDVIDRVNALIGKYGESRPGIAPLVILKALASLALVSLRMAG